MPDNDDLQNDLDGFFGDIEEGGITPEDLPSSKDAADDAAGGAEGDADMAELLSPEDFEPDSHEAPTDTDLAPVVPPSKADAAEVVVPAGMSTVDADALIASILGGPPEEEVPAEAGAGPVAEASSLVEEKAEDLSAAVEDAFAGWGGPEDEAAEAAPEEAPAAETPAEAAPAEATRSEGLGWLDEVAEDEETVVREMMDEAEVDEAGGVDEVVRQVEPVAQMAEETAGAQEAFEEISAAEALEELAPAAVGAETEEMEAPPEEVLAEAAAREAEEATEEVLAEAAVQEVEEAPEEVLAEAAVEEVEEAPEEVLAEAAVEDVEEAPEEVLAEAAVQEVEEALEPAAAGMFAAAVDEAAEAAPAPELAEDVHASAEAAPAPEPEPAPWVPAILFDEEFPGRAEPVAAEPVAADDISRPWRWVAVGAWGFMIWALSTAPSASIPDVGLVGADKVAHAVVFAVLAVLVARTLYGERPQRPAWLIFMAAVVACALYGGFSEYHQAVSAIGRHGSVWDFAADAGGAFIGAGVYLAGPVGTGAADATGGSGGSGGAAGPGGSWGAGGGPMLAGT